MTLSAMTHIGHVALTVADLPRALRFYTEIAGMQLREHTHEGATLGTATRPLLTLTELPGARPKPQRATGLYHFAILVPSRAALGRSLAALAAGRYPLGGASDHGVSEALYLSDPDGNGIEIYRDRPRDAWPMRGGELAMVTDPLDLQALVDDRDGDGVELDAATTIGHVHLHVADIVAAQHFYCDALGFDLMQRFGNQAAFVSAGGYHHHVGLNTWAGVGAPPPPPGSAGLRHYTIELPDAAALAAAETRMLDAGAIAETLADGRLWRDPSHNGLRLTIG